MDRKEKIFAAFLASASFLMVSMAAFLWIYIILEVARRP
jgi:hypothetical protein